jgi:hypothetical protein
MFATTIIIYNSDFKKYGLPENGIIMIITLKPNSKGDFGQSFPNHSGLCVALALGAKAYTYGFRNVALPRYFKRLNTKWGRAWAKGWGWAAEKRIKVICF